MQRENLLNLEIPPIIFTAIRFDLFWENTIIPTYLVDHN